MGFTMKSPSAFAPRRRDTRFFAALKPAALLSRCEMHVLVGIFFRNKPVSSALKTCSGRYPSSSMRLVAPDTSKPIHDELSNYPVQAMADIESILEEI